MVEITEIKSGQELVEAISDVPLLRKSANGETIYPYKNARVRLEEMRLSDIRPVSLYVVKSGLLNQTRLRRELAFRGQDPFNLEASFRVSNKQHAWDLMPPIVEDDPEDGPCLIDGTHRGYQARLLGRKTFKALHIQAADPRYPIYAYANEWHEVVAYDEAPKEPTKKKKYRVDDPYSLYRDFSQLATSQPRQ